MEDDVWVRQDSLRFNVDAPNMEEGLQFAPRETRPLMGMTDIKRRIAEPADMIILAPSRNRRLVWDLMSLNIFKICYCK